MVKHASSSSPVLVALLAVTLSGLAGCATKAFVNREVEETGAQANARIEEVASQVEQTQAELSKLQASDAGQTTQIAQLSVTARQALERAQEAGVLAHGKLIMEVTLKDDSVRFPLGSAELSDEAKAVLAAIAQHLKEKNENVYVEIQGHTDATGPERFNRQLGEERAAVVRRYLAIDCGIPLSRMNVISYGESMPVADNSSREGRAANRRVGLVVLG